MFAIPRTSINAVCKVSARHTHLCFVPALCASTATMCRMARVLGNAMVWVSPSNKKLVDRGCRLITQVTDCTYEQACIRLFHAIEQVDALRSQGKEVPSPVAMAIEAVKTQD